MNRDFFGSGAPWSASYHAEFAEVVFGAELVLCFAGSFLRHKTSFRDVLTSLVVNRLLAYIRSAKSIGCFAVLAALKVVAGVISLCFEVGRPSNA